MFKLMSAAVVLLGSIASTAAATQECLRPAEAEAEQAIRFQTELMVVSETCHQQIYPRFVDRNRKELVGYQRRMIEHFRRVGAPRPMASLDTYMTHLANEVALRVGAQDVGALCHDEADFLAIADALDAKEFHRYIAEEAAARDGEQRRCE